MTNQSYTSLLALKCSAMETREELMKRFGLKEISKPPSPVRFRKHGEISTIEQEEQSAAHRAIDKIVENQGGYRKLYGQTFNKPPLRDHAADFSR